MTRSYIQQHILDLPSALAEKSIEAFKRFTASGLDYAPWIRCVCYLKGEKHRRHKLKECHGEPIPRADHPRGFLNRRTGQRVLTLHPYFGQDEGGNTLENVTADSEAFAARHGLLVRVSTDDWYYPGSSLLVEYRVEKN